MITNSNRIDSMSLKTISQVVIGINNYDSKSSEHGYFHKKNITITSHPIKFLH